MGFIESKKQAINGVALLEVMGNLPKGRSTSSLDSVNSKSKNILPFLLDLLSTTCKDNSKNVKERASCEATKILIKTLVQFYPSLLRILKEGFINGVKAGLACGANFTIPSPAPNMVVKLKKIDFNDMMKTDPMNPIGSLFYGKNNKVDFNWFLYDLIQSGGYGNWKGILDLTYNKTTEELTIKIDDSYIGQQFNKFLLDYINSIQLMQLETMVTKIMDLVTGSINSNLPNANLSLDKLISTEKVNKSQDKINSSDPCKEDYDFDSYYEFTNDDLFDMENIANQKYIGTTELDLGCGILPVTIQPETMLTSFNTIRNAPPSKVSDYVEQSMNDINNDLVVNVPDSDKKVAIESLNLKFLTDLPKVFTNIVLEPKMVILYQISSKTINDIEVNASNSYDYTKATNTFFSYVCRESMAALVEIIFNEVKREIMVLVSEIAQKIVKDQASLKVKAIASIVTGVVDGVIQTIPTPNTSEFV